MYPMNKPNVYNEPKHIKPKGKVVWMSKLMGPYSKEKEEALKEYFKNKKLEAEDSKDDI